MLSPFHQNLHVEPQADLGAYCGNSGAVPRVYPNAVPPTYLGFLPQMNVSFELRAVLPQPFRAMHFDPCVPVFRWHSCLRKILCSLTLFGMVLSLTSWAHLLSRVHQNLPACLHIPSPWVSIRTSPFTTPGDI